MSHHRVAMIGSGAWGSALRSVLQAQGVPVMGWNRSVKPGTTQNLAQVLEGQPTVILAIAAAHIPDLCRDIKGLEEGGNQKPIQRLWIASKGLDPQTGDVLSTTIQRFWPQAQLGVMAGPNIALEIQRGLACGITLATPHEAMGQEAASWLAGSPLWVEPSADLLGVQWWSVLKNVVAIGYGLLQQGDLGYNLSASYLTRAVQEIASFVVDKKGQWATALTLAGIGDVMLTSHCPVGRNRVYGQHFPAHPTSLVEGRETLKTLEKQAWFTTRTPPLPLLRAVSLALKQPTAAQGIDILLTALKDKA